MRPLQRFPTIELGPHGSQRIAPLATMQGYPPPIPVPMRPAMLAPVPVPLDVGDRTAQTDLDRTRRRRRRHQRARVVAPPRRGLELLTASVALFALALAAWQLFWLLESTAGGRAFLDRLTGAR